MPDLPSTENGKAAGETDWGEGGEGRDCYEFSCGYLGF